MAYDRAEFEKLLIKYFDQLALPIFTRALVNESANNGGKLWRYISEMVVEGVDLYVYDAYHPKKKVYKRRGKNHGLGDPHNVQIVVTKPYMSNGTVVAGISIINTTLAGIIDDIDDDGNTVQRPGGDSKVYETDGGRLTRMVNATIGNGGFIEDQIISGTGYRFPLGVGSTGSFRKPRDFYQTYYKKYSAEEAFRIIVDSVEDEFNEAMDEAFELAYNEFMNKK